MPQMMPINWMISFLFFILIFLLFNIMNYFIFNVKIKNNSYNKISSKNIPWKW